MISAYLRKMDVPVCSFFQQGRCTYGTACRYLHPTPNYAAFPAGSPFQHQAPFFHSPQHHIPSAVGSSPRMGSRSRSSSSSSTPRRSSRSYRKPAVEPMFHERSMQESPPELTQQVHQLAAASGHVGTFTFRIMSYNLLADHLSRAHADYLYPDRAHDNHLDWFKHRQPLALAEMLHWSPDIICAQEVDHYPELARELAKEGYAGAFMQRTGGHRDGCATFWRASRLVAVRMEHVAYNRYDLKDNVALLVHLAPRRPDDDGNGSGAMSASPNSQPHHHQQQQQHAAPLEAQDPPPSASASAAAAIASAKAAASVAALSDSLACASPGGIVVANTHILFNTKRGDVKLGQLRTVLHKIKEMAQAAACGGASIGCMLAGDYNTAPGSPLYQFMQNGVLQLNHYDKQLLSGQVEGMGHAQYQRALRSGYPAKQGYQPDPLPQHHLPISSHPHHQHQHHRHQHSQTQQEDLMQQQVQHQQQWQGPHEQSAHTPYAAEQGPPPPNLAEQQHHHHHYHHHPVANPRRNSQRGGSSSGSSSGRSSLEKQEQHRRYVHWDDEGLRLALGVCPSMLPNATDNKQSLHKALRADFLTQREAVRRQQARQGLLTARSPLYPLQSAYATVTGREPAFSTCHSRCIDTVDYIWYTPRAISCRDQQQLQTASSSGLSPPLHAHAAAVGEGRSEEVQTNGTECDMDCDEEMSSSGSGGQGQPGAGALVLHPLRVLLPPDSTRFPLGMPNGRWASDHVSLVCDFRLFLQPPQPMPSMSASLELQGGQ